MTIYLAHPKEYNSIGMGGYRKGSVDEDYQIRFGTCREGACGSLRDFYYKNEHLQDDEHFGHLIGITGKTSKPKLRNDVENAMKLLGPFISDLLFFQRDEDMTEEGVQKFLRDWSNRWFYFNDTPDGYDLFDPIGDYNIQFKMNRVHNKGYGSVMNVPMKFFEHRALTSFLMAVPRAFQELSGYPWLYVGHREVTYKKYNNTSKVFQQVYSAIGDAFSLYRYTSKYWWAFLFSLIESVGPQKEGDIIEKMKSSPDHNGVRNFMRAIKWSDDCSTLIELARKYGISAFSRVDGR